MYDREIDKKWQKVWEEHKCFHAETKKDKEKFFGLIEFPYPSGAGLHVGHARAFMGMEVTARKRRMQGYNVLFPIGFDAFGLPTENYAMKTGIHPRKVTDDNIATFTKQLKSIGFSFDYDRVIDTTDPHYYKWTQWIFLQLFKHGLAYKDKTYVNYCPNCRVILANEESQGGKCDRCDSEIVQLEKEVWMLKITEYADKLLEGLDEVNFTPRVRLEQENWIGRSFGAEVTFSIENEKESLQVYTTRPDTIFGVTYMAIAPEHPLLETLKDKITNYDEVIAYKEEAKKKSEFERVELAKDKTGVEVKGIRIVNPLTKETIPLWVTDYVMMGYGTGAIMAVPAHDTRDFEFAQKFGIATKQVVAPMFENQGKDHVKEGVPNTKRKTTVAIIKHPKEEQYLVLDWLEEYGWKSFVMGGIEDGETAVEAAIREMTEETGYVDVKSAKKVGFDTYSKFYAAHKGVNREVSEEPVIIELNSLEQMPTKAEETKNHRYRWVAKEEIAETITIPSQKMEWDMYMTPAPFIESENGRAVNSDFLNGMAVKEAKEAMTAYVKEHNIGEPKKNYHMKDWAFARQRYWGEPVPIVKCESCGLVALEEKDLPLTLPEVDNFMPGEDGQSPLAKVDSWVNTTCPHCGGPAKRETDTMPQWAGSSWYYLRYIDPHNDKAFADKAEMDYWLPVDWYNGGMEHVTRHLIYSRFWHRFLYDIGVVPTKEPYAKRTTQGLILGPDGNKMSKSKGNVINPDDIVKTYGADTLRTYILFIGEYSLSAPWSENGVKGAKKFLDRVMRLASLVTKEDITSKELDLELHKTIKKVSEDIEEMKYNTAIAAMMSYVNILYKQEKVSMQYIRPFLQILNPVAPHVTEELWERLGLEGHIFETKWPSYDPSKMVLSKIEMPVQINGVLRFKIEIDSDISEEEIKQLVLEDDRLKPYLQDKEIKKIIVIKSRIVNVVVGS